MIVNDGGDTATKFSVTFFENDSSAGNGTFIANGSPSVNGANASVQFDFTSTAGTGTFIANGAEVAGDSAYGGVIDVRSDSTADHGTFYANGGNVSGANGGTIELDNSASAENGT